MCMAIGYACVHIGSELTKLSTLRLANATPENIRRVIRTNLQALAAMMRYNADHEIKLFRISSDIIPLASHPAMQVDWRSEYRETLASIGGMIRRHEIRVSMHPGQYTVLNSPGDDVVQNAVADLRYHCAFLDALGCDAANKVIVHVGGVYGDKTQAIRRFIKNYALLDDCIKTRLAVENDDRSYTAGDVLSIAEQTGLPVVFDVFHHILNDTGGSLSVYDWIDRCGKTWGAKDGRQKIHYSQTNPNARSRGAHSETINLNEFLAFYHNLHHKDVDVMLEVKDKNLSAVKCILATEDHPKIQELESEWARYKYLVLGQSAASYQKIRTLLKDKANADPLRFYALIDEALAMPEDQGAQINAAQHVWGYVSKAASSKQRRQFQTLIEAYRAGARSLSAVKRFLFRLADAQQLQYLLDSLFFYR